MRINFHSFSTNKAAILTAALGLASLLGGCAVQTHSFFQPAGPIAAADKRLLIEVVLLMLIVVAPVLVLTPIIAWHYRRKNSQSVYDPEWEFSWLFEILVWGVPFLIVAILGYMVWTKTHDLDPYRALASTQPPLEVQVVGLNWKWLFIYPEQNIATVNELVFPVNRPVHLTLTSDTVMLSLLIPRLVGQIYAMPGMTTRLNLEADRTGRYIGENTQYNGNGFAQQKFTTLALSKSDFATWVKQVRAGGSMLDHDAYAKIAVHDIPPHPIYFARLTGTLFYSIIAKYHGRPTIMSPAEQTKSLTTDIPHHEF